MNIDWTVILIVGGVALILLTVGVYAYWRERKRIEDLQQFAQENSLVFARNDKEYSQQLTKQPEFDLFRHGYGKHAFNFLRGQRYEMNINLFDYQYSTSGGQHQQIHRQTVALINLDRPELVRFNLQPSGFFQKIAEKLGRKNIDFETRPEFSRRFNLRGSDESGIRRIFNDPLLALFEQQDKLSCEATEDKLLIYRHNRRVRLEDLRAFMDTVNQIVDLLRRPTIAGDLYDFGIPKN